MANKELESAKAAYERGEISKGELDDVAIADFEKNKQKIYKSPLAQADALQPRKIALDFANMKDNELLDHFVKSSGWGFSGKLKNNGFHFKGPDWEPSYNPMTRQQVIDELLERKRIDEEEDGDWFDYLDEDD